MLVLTKSRLWLHRIVVDPKHPFRNVRAMKPQAPKARPHRSHILRTSCWLCAVAGGDRSSDYNNRNALRCWVEGDRDCQDARPEVLIAASATPAQLRSRACSFGQGAGFDHYTAQTFSEARYIKTDHLVPIACAWRRGASEGPEGEADRSPSILTTCGS